MVVFERGLRDETSYGQSTRCPADRRVPCAGTRARSVAARQNAALPTRAGPRVSPAAAVPVPSRASPLLSRNAGNSHRPSDRVYCSSGRAGPRPARAGSGSGRPLLAARSGTRLGPARRAPPAGNGGSARGRLMAAAGARGPGQCCASSALRVAREQRPAEPSPGPQAAPRGAWGRPPYSARRSRKGGSAGGNVPLGRAGPRARRPAPVGRRRGPVLACGCRVAARPCRICRRHHVPRAWRSQVSAERALREEEMPWV